MQISIAPTSRTASPTIGAGVGLARTSLPRTALAARPSRLSGSGRTNARVAPRASASVKAPVLSNEVKYLLNRLNIVTEHFPSAISLDDFMFRVEMALCAYGFTGDNSVGVANMCRDEITCALKYSIEQAFPLVFNINGLGGGITAGVTGIGAGLSHSPKSVTGKARYVFFSFPHIAISSKGIVGSIGRPGQDKTNLACGALIAALGQLKAEGLEPNVKEAGYHVAKDPEYSILKQRLARRMIQEEVDPAKIDLVEITKLAERQISSDLEFLVSKAVDVKRADYAIVTGVQIHNWSDNFDDAEPNFEFVAPSKISVVINGVRSELDLEQLPSPTPRQLMKLSGTSLRKTTRSVAVYTGTSTLTNVSGSPMFSSMDELAMKPDREEMFGTFVEASGAKSFESKNGLPPADEAVL